MTKTIRDVRAEDFPAFCRGHGLKCTVQRLAVFSYLHAGTGHPSVDEVWAEVKKTVPTITRDSVYRILNEFSEIGLITRMDALSAARYDMCLGPHAHFICEVCGCVIDYPLPDGLRLPAGMPPEQHHVELRVTGLCPKCAKKNQQSNNQTIKQ